MGDIVANRVLNRTLLARQHLLERSAESVPDLLEHLVGLQAQDVVPPFVALWSRVEGFDPDTVSAGLDDRSLARITLMRGTIHLVTRRDALRIASHIQPELAKVPFRKGFFFGATVGMDADDVRARGERLLGDEPISAADLRALAAAEWPDHDAQAMVQTLLYLLPVLQTPPRGKWKHNNRPVWSRIDAWFGEPLVRDYPIDDLLLRYLRAFGPATTADMQAWSRFTGLREVVDRLGGQLRTYRDEQGRILYDVDGLELADPDSVAPVRFLGWYDNALLSHKDRSRIIPEMGGLTLSTMAMNVATFLVDGYTAGIYKMFVEGDRARLRYVPRRSITKRQIAAIEAEGARLLAFLEADKQPSVELVESDADLKPSKRA